MSRYEQGRLRVLGARSAAASQSEPWNCQMIWAHHPETWFGLTYLNRDFYAPFNGLGRIKYDIYCCCQQMTDPALKPSPYITRYANAGSSMLSFPPILCLVCFPA